ncbi:MFS transporter [Cellulomonas soli]|uniref:MFS transporter n=1 Tax=Cellulomonas soli TaxID=931535 RepID=UPI003F82B116
MSLSPYTRLLARPEILRLVLIGLVARLPHAATGVVVTLHVTSTLGYSYGAAGVVTAAMTIGMAIGAPWRGRRVDRIGLRKALVPTVLVESAVWIAAPHLEYRLLVVAAFVAGVFLVPVFSVVRQSLAVLVPPVQQKTAYALDSVCTELTFMLGPVLGVLLATQVSTAAALLTIGASTVGAGVVLIWTDPPTRSEQPVDAVEVPAPVAADRSPLRSPQVWAILAAGTAASLVLTGTDLGIVAQLQHLGANESIGWVIAVWAFGSVIGGLVYGASHRTVPPLALVLAMSVLTIPAAFASSVWTVAVAVVIAGLFCAPALSSITAALVAAVPEARRGEVLGWSGTASTLGGSLGAPLIGVAIDRASPQAGFLASALIGVVLTVVGLVLLGAVRARRGVVAAPVVPEQAQDQAQDQAHEQARQPEPAASSDAAPVSGATPRAAVGPVEVS